MGTSNHARHRHEHPHRDRRLQERSHQRGHRLRRAVEGASCSLGLRTSGWRTGRAVSRAGFGQRRRGRSLGRLLHATRQCHTLEARDYCPRFMRQGTPTGGKPAPQSGGTAYNRSNACKVFKHASDGSGAGRAADLGPEPRAEPARPVATERLRPARRAHAWRWRSTAGQSLLPPPPPLAWRVTPAGLLEWCGHRRPRTWPTSALCIWTHRQPRAAGDAARCRRHAAGRCRSKATRMFAGDVNWLVQNLRWDASPPTWSGCSARWSRSSSCSWAQRWCRAACKAALSRALPGWANGCARAGPDLKPRRCVRRSPR